MLKYLLIQIFTSLPDKSEELLKVNLVVAKKIITKACRCKKRIKKTLPLKKKYLAIAILVHFSEESPHLVYQIIHKKMHAYICCS